jgi:AraC-like DNA-binding protein
VLPGNDLKRSFNATPHQASNSGPRANDAIQDLVRRSIEQLLPSEPTILAVAKVLSLNVRTLQRRLAESGVSYRRLLDECRRQRAEEELGRHELPVAEVSRRLGYSDPAHFVRAFRRWTGHAPTHFGPRHKETHG